MPGLATDDKELTQGREMVEVGRQGEAVRGDADIVLLKQTGAKKKRS